MHLLARVDFGKVMKPIPFSKEMLWNPPPSSSVGGHQEVIVSRFVSICGLEWVMEDGSPGPHSGYGMTFVEPTMVLLSKDYDHVIQNMTCPCRLKGERLMSLRAALDWIASEP